MFNRFEDIEAWKKAQNLVLLIYKSLKDCKDRSFKDQMCRAVISIANNIAEGFERRTNKDFKNFLFISKGSCGEVRSMSFLALKLNYIDRDNFDSIFVNSEEISKMLSDLIKTL